MNPESLFPLYRLYHKNQHDMVDPDAVDSDDQDWSAGGYKEYDRLGSVSPPDGFDPDADEVVRTLRARSSFADATDPRPVTREELFTVLHCAYRVDSSGTRPVASGGRRYPLEIYPLVLDSPDMDAGLYHYNPAENVLERPADPEYVRSTFGPLDSFVSEHWSHLSAANEISVMFLVTGIPSRSAVKYDERGYLFTLIEAGEVLHAMQLAAGHLGIGSRPYAGFRYDRAAELLGTASDDREWVVVSLALASPE